jgi:SAM-dependent methyltransferase
VNAGIAGAEAKFHSAAATGEIAGPHEKIARYYTDKVLRHGATPLGVDWSCAPTQELRFLQLLRFEELPTPCSLNDLGCGYGALFGFVSERRPETRFDYLGIDVSPEMVERARHLWRHARGARFVGGNACPRRADYSVASGIFNVNLWFADAQWEELVARTLAQMRRSSRRGFAVNFLLQQRVSGSATGLYRTLPSTWVRYCERELGCDVEIVEKYGLQEFTLLARPASRKRGKFDRQ